MSNRGEPPWHCAALASVNDADWNVWPVRPVMSAWAAAFVAVGQFLARWSTPLLYDELTQPAGVIVANSSAGGKVNLQVSAGAHPKPPTAVPDETGQEGQAAQSALTNEGFSVIAVDWPVSDTASDGVVVYETPTGDAPRGSAVVVYVGSAQ